MRTFLRVPLAIAILGLGVPATATADPTILAQPSCTGTNFGPEAGPRQDGKDTVQATADVRCPNASFYVEVIFHTTGDGHDWTDDVANWARPAVLITSANHKVGGDLEGQVYTVTATVKVWAGPAFCGTPANCYPFGTPLQTFDLPAVSAPVYD